MLKPLRLGLVAGLLASGVTASAITVTTVGTIESWSLFDPDYPPPIGPFNWLTGYEDVAVGDPFSVRFTFDETALVVSGSTDPVTYLGAVTSFEFLLGDEPKFTFTNLNLTLRNGYGGVDEFRIFSPTVTTPIVDGLTGWGPRGYATLILTDASNLALQEGQPIDFARFFDQANDHYGLSTGFQTGGPYSGAGPAAGAGSNNASLWTPPPASVPDDAATGWLLGLGLLPLLCRARLRARS